MTNTLLTQTSRAPAFNRFLRSPIYVLSVSGVILLSSIFALDIPLYTLLAALCCAICLFSDDLLPLAPIVTQVHMSFSMDNNPGANPTPIFSMSRYGIYLIVIVALAAACFLFRLFTDKRFGGKAFFTKKRRLLGGMLLLGLAYLLGGSFSTAWEYDYIVRKTAIFSLLQLVVIALPYIVITGFVDWENAPRDYLLWVGVGMAGLVFFQVGHIYIAKDLLSGNGLDREAITNGWGMRNNIGGMLAMMLPCVFYLGSRYRKPLLGIAGGTLVMVGILLTTSRSSLIAGGILWLVCSYLQLRPYLSKKTILLILAGLLLCGGLVLVAMWDKIMAKVLAILDLGNVLDSNNRTLLYHEGIKQFLRFPVFGGSFFPIDFTPHDWSTVASFSGIFPPRWHNTVVQLLASTGVVGLVAYGFHRFQTVKLYIQNRTTENTYLAFSILILLLTSLLDCHFFNFGPVLYYSIALAFIECSGVTDEV